MKCPLLAIAWGHVASEEAINYPDCLKEECAWWDHDRNICAAKSIFHDLTNIRIELREIKDTMPSG